MFYISCVSCNGLFFALTNRRHTKHDKIYERISLDGHWFIFGHDVRMRKQRASFAAGRPCKGKGHDRSVISTERDRPFFGHGARRKRKCVELSADGKSEVGTGGFGKPGAAGAVAGYTGRSVRRKHVSGGKGGFEAGGRCLPANEGTA